MTTPRGVTVARSAALTQAVLALAVAVICAAYTAGVVRAGHRAAATGDTSWTGMGEFFGGAGVVLALSAAGLVGVPAILLRPGRPDRRTRLMIAEVLLAVPVTQMLISDVLGRTQPGWGSAAFVWDVLAVLTMVSVRRPDARAWAGA